MKPKMFAARFGQAIDEPGNALLMLTTIGIGFGGRPWVAIAIASALIIWLRFPQQVETLKRYRGQPLGHAVILRRLTPAEKAPG